MSKIIQNLIKLYQSSFSPDHGLVSCWPYFNRCRYFPSCSEYCRLAVARYGAIKGITAGLKRLLRCHPWSAGGYDPVPHSKIIKVKRSTGLSPLRHQPIRASEERPLRRIEASGTPHRPAAAGLVRG